MNIWIAGKDLMKQSYHQNISTLNLEDISDDDYPHEINL